MGLGSRTPARGDPNEHRWSRDVQDLIGGVRDNGPQLGRSAFSERKNHMRYCREKALALSVCVMAACSQGAEKPSGGSEVGPRDEPAGEGGSLAGTPDSGVGGQEALGGTSSVEGGPSSGGQEATGGGPSIEPVDFEFGVGSVYVVNRDETFDARTLGPVEGNAPVSQYGGDLSRNVGGTGFFRTVEIDGGWYFVDPDGYLYISLALNSVIPGGEVELPQALKSMGFNGLGNWSDYEAINEGEEKIPHTIRGSFLASFARDDSYDGGTEYLEGLLDAGVLPIVFSDFDEFCEGFAQQFEASKDDPWVLGIFSDNELPFYDGGARGFVLDRWMALDSSDLYFGYAEDWLEDRGKSSTNYDDQDRDAFAGHIVDVYYSKVSAALRRYDANHLYIGTRFHGAAKRQASVMSAAGPYVDVVSVNYYNDWTPDRESMDMWLSSAKKPFLISEYYVKGEDSGLGNVDGAGWTVRTQADRAAFYTHWHLSFYSHPGAIGTHWFRYIDKAGQDSNKGLISEQFEWYSPLVDAATNANRQIYQLVEHLRAE